MIEGLGFDEDNWMELIVEWDFLEGLLFEEVFAEWEESFFLWKVESEIIPLEAWGKPFLEEDGSWGKAGRVLALVAFPWPPQGSDMIESSFFEGLALGRVE